MAARQRGRVVNIRRGEARKTARRGTGTALTVIFLALLAAGTILFFGPDMRETLLSALGGLF